MKKEKKSKSTAYHHGDLRRALMEEGLKVISHEGVGRLNLRDLARKVGVSHGAPYRHFLSREDLVAELAIEGAETFLSYLEGARARVVGDTEARFREMGLAYLRFALEHPDHYRLIFNRQFPPGLAGEKVSHMSATMKASFESLRGAVVEMQEAGLLRPEDPFLLSSAIWSHLHGIVSLWIDGRFGGMEGRSPASPELFLEKLLSYLRSGICPVV